MREKLFLKISQRLQLNSGRLKSLTALSLAFKMIMSLDPFIPKMPVLVR
jgi:hypothetical protein